MATTAPPIHTGRRKSSVARVRLYPGSGQFRINRRPLEDFFQTATQRETVLAPLKLTARDDIYDVVADVGGGGASGQAGAIRLGIARGLSDEEPDLRTPLKRAGMLTRDPRAPERKKYGRKKARKMPQFSKR